MELKESILSCIEFVKMAIRQNDKDMLNSYYEQLNDLIIEFMENED